MEIVTARQLPLFPLDPWGAEHAFAVLDRPCPGIARAMVGPLSLGTALDTADDSLRCLAATEDGAFVACINTKVQHIQNLGALWETVLLELDAVRHQPSPAIKAGSGFRPDDCLKAWSDPQFWLPRPRGGAHMHRSLWAMAKLLIVHGLAEKPCLTHEDRLQIESDALMVLGRQIASGVLLVLDALDPELCEISTNRPRMSVSMAHRLVSLARKNDPLAVPYALQALRTEPVAVLHLAASGDPEAEARQVREAIFSGRSLPDTLNELGVAKAAHRRSVKSFVRCAEQAPGQGERLGDLPISGRDWLTAMRITKNLPFQGREEWEEFCRLVTKLFSLPVQHAETLPKLLRWCVLPGYARSCHRLELLLSQARAFATAARGLAGIDVALDDAISLGLALLGKPAGRAISGAEFGEILDPQNLGQLVAGVSQISGKSMVKLMHKIFDAHPGIPYGFRLPESTTVHALDSLDLVRAHGAVCDNCLQSPETTIQYVASGLALYAVRSGSCNAGTIALCLDGMGKYPQVQVEEVRAVNNAEASPTLSKVAQSLADSWATTPQLASWVAYERQCARWRQLAGAP
ncbi:hypothetical protein [Polaromonas sp.]|uniref:hypothetical protein n=1 Tax=Polaromonas sp. TaxID=1869339 RepID=UPI00286B886F|nr:hypothetical protein [Polaromonas sp.]